MVRLGYARFGLVSFGYTRFLYMPKSYAFHPRFFFPDCHIMAFNQAMDFVVTYTNARM